MTFYTDWFFKVCWWLPSYGCCWCLKESRCHRRPVFCFSHFGNQHFRYNAQHIWFQVSSYMIILEKNRERYLTFWYFPTLDSPSNLSRSTKPEMEARKSHVISTSASKKKMSAKTKPTYRNWHAMLASQKNGSNPQMPLFKIKQSDRNSP